MVSENVILLFCYFFNFQLGEVGGSVLLGIYYIYNI
jgi:hypothetical protein